MALYNKGPVSVILAALQCIMDFVIGILALVLIFAFYLGIPWSICKIGMVVFHQDITGMAVIKAWAGIVYLCFVYILTTREI